MVRRAEPGCRIERMPDRSRKRPRDLNQLAKSLVEDSISEGRPEPVSDDRDPAAVALGRLGGLKGGKARAARMSADERSESARRAAAARWAKKQ